MKHERQLQVFKGTGDWRESQSKIMKDFGFNIKVPSSCYAILISLRNCLLSSSASSVNHEKFQVFLFYFSFIFKFVLIKSVSKSCVVGWKSNSSE